MKLLFSFARKHLGIILPVTLLLLSSFAGAGLFKYTVYSAHDFDHHISRSYDAIQTIKEGHFPLRWAGSLNFDCGVAIFNFFYPLIYYMMVVLNTLLNKVVFSFKLINLGSFIFGTLFFYLWMKWETRDKLSSFAGALLYLFAPYRFLLIYVRSSPEFLAYAIFPLVAYLFSKTIHEIGRKKILFGLAASFSGAALAISHNFAVLFLMPILALFILTKMVIVRPLKTNIFLTLFSFIGSFGLASFFIGPAILEQQFVKLGKLNVVDFHDHFPTLLQLFRSPWGYFYSNPGVNDGMSFMLGYAHWFILGVAGILILYKLFIQKKPLKKFLRKNIWVITFTTLSVFSIFLMLPVSTPIWEAIGPLAKIQFPWRILGVSVLFLSILGTLLLTKLRNTKIFWPLFIFISFLAIYGNKNHLQPFPIHPDIIYLYDHYEKLHFNRYTTTTLGDDVVATNAPGACNYSTEKVKLENGVVPKSEIVEKKNTSGVVKFLLKEEEINQRIVFELSYFPGAYEFNVNGIDTKDYKDCSGFVCIDSPHLREVNLVSWKIVQTPIQKIFNILSLGFVALWLVLLAFSVFKIKPSRKNILTTLLVIGTFSVFMFFRNFNIEKRVIFNWDQERDAAAATEILSGDLKLIGPRALGPEGFYLPPYFFYILTPFYALTGGAYAIIYFLIFYNILFFSFTLVVLKKLFGMGLAIVFLFLWGVNPLTISMDTLSWNPVLLPLLFILLLYLLYLYWNTTNLRFLFLLGVNLALGFSSHVQFLLLAPLLVPFVFKGIKTQEKVKLLFGRLFPLTLGFLLVLSPLLLFDIKNGFLNSKLIFSFLGKVGTLNVSTFPSIMGNFFNSLLLVSFPGFGFVTLFALFILFAFLLKKLPSGSFEKLLSGGMLLVVAFVPIAFVIYGKIPSEYYFNFLAFLVFFGVALVVNFFWKKLKLVILPLLILVLSFWSIESFRQLRDNKLSYYYKNKTVEFIKLFTRGENTKFNLSFDVPFNEDSGFRYLLKQHKVYPSGDPVDTLIEFVIPPSRKENSYPVGGVGVYIPDGYLDQIGLKSQE